MKIRTSLALMPRPRREINRSMAVKRGDKGFFTGPSFYLKHIIKRKDNKTRNSG
jgi:hypothetical protein